MALHKNPKYDIKRNYRRIIKLGFIFSLLIVISAFKFLPEVKKDLELPISFGEPFIGVDVIENTRQNSHKIPPKPAEVKIEIKNDVEDDIILDETDLFPNETVEPPINIPPKIEPVKETEKYIFLVLEEYPEPIGGMLEIMNKIEYPEIAIKTNIEGRVVIAASINEKGEVVKAEIVKGIGGGCDEEAVKAVLATRFSPGLQRGVPVKVKVNIPISFKLK